MMDNEKKNKKNIIHIEYYITYNKDEKQTKEFLRYFTNSMQYTLLREFQIIIQQKLKIILKSL